MIIDYETYSEAGYRLGIKRGKITVESVGAKGGLPDVGVYVYVEHPSFEVISLHYRSFDNSVSCLWTPDQPSPDYLLNYVANGGMVEAHNIQFEAVVWNNYCVKAFGWPTLQLEQTRCSAAKCRRYSLPGSLAQAAEVIGGEQKDSEGKNLIRKLTRPVTPTKKHPSFRWTPSEAPEDFKKFYAYNAQDTAAEMTLSQKVPDLTPYERDAWLADQQINNRGVYVDRVSLAACTRLLESFTAELAAEFKQITGGYVQTINETKKFCEWLSSRGVSSDSVDKKSVADMLGKNIPPDARRALEIRQALGGANSKKLYAIEQRLNADGRLRGSYIYCGADRTGRWASVGVQLQNITAAGPATKNCLSCGRIIGATVDRCLCGATEFKDRGEWGLEEMAQALADARSMQYADVIRTWGSDINSLLSGCLRGLFAAPPGHELVCADFSAIEAVVLACLSRCQWRIDVFSTHGKIYETTASQISGIPLDEILAYKKIHGQHHPYRKKLGKIPELASGYAGWIGAWKNFGADKFFDSDDDIKKAILAWRARSPEIVEFWGGQHRQVGEKPWDSVPELYGVEGSVVSAILNPGQYYNCGDISFLCDMRTLFCRLPSGRLLYYHQPKLTLSSDYFRRPVYKIAYYGYNTNAEKGPTGWVSMETYGGRLVENVVQAVSADIQAEALIRAHAAGYPVVMHTHDELVAEVPQSSKTLTLEGLINVMRERPAWASWWPIKAAGWTGTIYHKD